MKKKLFVCAAVLAMLTGATALVTADTIGGDEGNQVLDIVQDPPGGGECYCPAVWAPVVCRMENPDGSISRAAFSNGCVAGCYGYTKCVRISGQI